MEFYDQEKVKSFKEKLRKGEIEPLSCFGKIPHEVKDLYARWKSAKNPTKEEIKNILEEYLRSSIRKAEKREDVLFCGFIQLSFYDEILPDYFKWNLNLFDEEKVFSYFKEWLEKVKKYKFYG